MRDELGELLEDKASKKIPTIRKYFFHGGAVGFGFLHTGPSSVEKALPVKLEDLLLTLNVKLETKLSLAQLRSLADFTGPWSMSWLVISANKDSGSLLQAISKLGQALRLIHGQAFEVTISMLHDLVTAKNAYYVSAAALALWANKCLNCWLDDLLLWFVDNHMRPIAGHLSFADHLLSVFPRMGHPSSVSRSLELEQAHEKALAMAKSPGAPKLVKTPNPRRSTRVKKRTARPGDSVEASPEATSDEDETRKSDHIDLRTMDTKLLPIDLASGLQVCRFVGTNRGCFQGSSCAFAHRLLTEAEFTDANGVIPDGLSWPPPKRKGGKPPPKGKGSKGKGRK